MNMAVEKALTEMQTPEANYLRDSLKNLKDDLKTLKDENRSKNFITDFKANKLKEIKTDYFALCQQEAEIQGVKIKNFEKIYRDEMNKNPEKRLLALKELELKFSTMDDEEIKSEAGKIKRTASDIFEIGQLELFQLEMKRRGFDGELTEIKAKIKENNLDKPWLHLEAGREAAEKQKFYSTIRPGNFRALYDDQSGGQSAGDYEIEKLID